MNWREATLVDLLGRKPSAEPTHIAPPRSGAPLGERALDLMRVVMVSAVTSIFIVLSSVLVVTWFGALVSGSRFVADAALSKGTVWDLPARLWRSMSTTWLISFVFLALCCALTMNLLFLAQRSDSLAIGLYALNVSAALLLFWWISACVRCAADVPQLSAAEILKAGFIRAGTPSRWHVAVTGALVSAVVLAAFSPPAALLLGPGLGLYLGRRAAPGPVTMTRSHP